MTHIQETNAVQDIKEDVLAIMNGPTDQVADSADDIVREIAHKRTIEAFKRRGRSVVLVKMHDVKVQDKKNKDTYARCEICSLTEQQLDEALGRGPSLAVEQWIAARVLLEMEGNPGGKTADYFKTARDLAQQRVYENVDIEKSAVNEMESKAPMDEDFIDMLNIVKEALIQKASNPYHQAKRDEYAAANGVLYRISADIAMVLDKDARVIAFQFSDAFSALLPALTQFKVAELLDTWTSAWPIPLPDMTRHGLHYISHLKKHPEFDARIPENDGHTAKSGVSHVGFRCQIGDPNGDKGVDYTLDTNLRCVHNPHLRAQLPKVQYGPFGACTELVGFFFRLLDPELFGDYRKVYENSSLRFDTRREGEFCSLTALLTNLMTNEHKDAADWEYGFAGLVPVGDYQGKRTPLLGGTVLTVPKVVICCCASSACRLKPSQAASSSSAGVNWHMQSSTLRGAGLSCCAQCMKRFVESRIRKLAKRFPDSRTTWDWTLASKCNKRTTYPRIKRNCQSVKCSPRCGQCLRTLSSQAVTVMRRSPESGSGALLMSEDHLVCMDLRVKHN